MARIGSQTVFAGLGFVALAGGFSLAAWRVMQPPPVPAFAATGDAGAEAAAPEEAPETIQLYVPLEDQIAVAVAERPERVMFDVAFSVRGPMEVLLGMKADVDAKKDTILAALLVAAQAEVVKSADPATLLASLPGPLREAANRAVGTANLPEPVEEVLVTGLVVQR